MRWQVGDAIPHRSLGLESFLEEPVLTPLEATIEVWLEANDPVGGDHPATAELPLHLFRRVHEHQLESAGLGELHDLSEGLHTRTRRHRWPDGDR